jgi:hypothetical protein
MQRPEDTSRIKRGKDEDRFYCPYPGCTRSFAELWRLKVHYRAPPDVRGSGKERGHGTELQFCPKCGKELKPGKHHVGCFAGRAGPRQLVKRAREVVSALCMLPRPRPLHVHMWSDCSSYLKVIDGSTTQPRIHLRSRLLVTYRKRTSSPRMSKPSYRLSQHGSEPAQVFSQTSSLRTSYLELVASISSLRKLRL